MQCCAYCGTPVPHGEACANAPECTNLLCSGCASLHSFCPDCEGRPDQVLAEPEEISDRESELPD